MYVLFVTLKSTETKFYKATDREMIDEFNIPSNVQNPFNFLTLVAKVRR